MSSKDILLAAAGGAANKPLYIEDAFSTYLYTGNDSTQTINNGIDLSGEGGMVWIKNRTQNNNHFLFDTARGALKRICSNTTDAEASLANSLISFDSNGFGTGTTFNLLSNNYASWTFRKAPKFFDVVTYTGDGVAGRQISHSLGQTPGMVVVKCTSTAQSWVVYHRGQTSAEYTTYWNSTSAQFSDPTIWNSTAPTDSAFTVGTSVRSNSSGATYVAYLFAHDTSTDGLIQCGSYTGNGSATGPTVTLGWEPQYVMVKASSATGNWVVEDNMRSMSQTSSAKLFFNLTSAETVTTQTIIPNATGFSLATTDAALNSSGVTYIYMAIRRGPMKIPTDGTTVFKPVTQSGGGFVTTNFPVDLTINGARSVVSDKYTFSRLTGSGAYLSTNSAVAESSASSAYNDFAFNNGIQDNFWGPSSIVYWNFRRAPSFFDVVCYTGTGANRTVSHNLGAAPELIFVKQRSSGTVDWQVYSNGLANTEYLVLNSTAAKATGTTRWNSTTPTSSVFSLGTASEVNASSSTYVSYLFTSCPGVSKVGAYTGTGATQTISCGFTGGARFVFIKRTDSTGDWYVWDTSRGMVSGTDPSLLLNSTAAEVNTNSVYTTTGGFQIVSTAAGINASGGSYIYLAIA